MKQSIATDAVKLTSSKIITLTIALVTSMLLSRFRSLEEYGTYSQLLLMINLFTTIFMMGLPNSINYFLARAEDGEQRRRFLSSYYSFATLLSVITGMILIISMPLITAYFKNPIITKFWFVLAIYPWTKIILSSVDNVFIVYRKTTHLMIFRILNSLYLLCAIVAIEYFKMGFFAYMLAFVAGEATFALSVYFIVRKRAGKLSIGLNVDILKKVLIFSIPIGLASVAGTLKIEMDKLIIAWFYNTEQLAIYSNAARELPFSIIGTSLTAVLLPQMARLMKTNERGKAVEIWGHAISLSYLIICFFAAGIFVFAPEAIEILYSHKYIRGTDVFRIYALVLLLRCTYFGMILNSMGRTKIILYSTIFTLLTSVILNIAFYYIFGFIGPALSTLVSTLFGAMYLLFATSREISIPMRKIFPWNNIASITIMNSILGSLFFLVKRNIQFESFLGQVGESLALGCVWCMIYFLFYRKYIKNYWLKLNVKN